MKAPLCETLDTLHTRRPLPPHLSPSPLSLSLSPRTRESRDRLDLPQRVPTSGRCRFVDEKLTEVGRELGRIKREAERGRERETRRNRAVRGSINPSPRVSRGASCEFAEDIRDSDAADKFELFPSLIYATTETRVASRIPVTASWKSRKPRVRLILQRGSKRYSRSSIPETPWKSH